MEIKSNFFSFITVSHGHFDDICELIRSIDTFWKGKCELVIIDNKNEDIFNLDYLQSLCKSNFLSIKLIKQYKFRSFSANNNLGVVNATYDNLFIINPDIKFYNKEVFDKYSSIKISSVYYPKLLNADFSIQEHYNAWPNFIGQLLRLFRYKLGLKNKNKNKNMGWFFAAAIILSKHDFFAIDGFNEHYSLYCEDVDFYHKLKCKNINVIYDDDISLIHNLGGESKGKYLLKAISSNIKWRFFRVWNYLYYR
ncbi:glycosyltransferase family 2 protein [Photobacterium damselae]|uniref:glycosyltransferase family 2 protein n=1 Tax=Photobacterium damselae TaxID=38293 RepID=UPI001593AC04|nr:hypothetical protein [Photobacterium damselae]NVH48270.1 hypothetical protein [Photobacterium damselae subsp. damselae]